MSLPKIKTVAVEESQNTKSQHTLKFKKLKLSTDQTSNLERFKSLKTQRLRASLSRYSTLEEQREYKNQKIHMNLLERKLLTGTYDETQQTGQGLNTLKHKTDQYKALIIDKKKQVQKLREMIQDTKKQIQIYTKQKKQRDDKINTIKSKCQSQKQKTKHTLSQRQCLDQMILTRKNINIFLSNKLNQDKAYLTKLKGLSHHIEYQLRQSHQKGKNIETQIKRYNEEVSRQQKTREESIYQKQSNIQRRTEGELLRQRKSKEYVQYLQQIDQNQEQKQFNDLYFGILCNKFLQKYNSLYLDSLQEKYQIVENKYNQIASYKTFTTPEDMVKRFSTLKQEQSTYRQKIKYYQSRLLQLQHLQEKNEQFYEKLTLTQKNGQVLPQYDKEVRKEIEDLKHERQCQKIQQQTTKLEKIIQEIGKWSERYGKQLEIGTKKSGKWEDISLNLHNVMKVSLKQTKQLNKK